MCNTNIYNSVEIVAICGTIKSADRRVELNNICTYNQTNYTYHVLVVRVQLDSITW